MKLQKFLNLTVSNGIGVLTIEREAKLNALDAGMIEELAQLCREIERRDDVGVLVVTGSGRSFCAGGDVAAWSAEPAEKFSRHWVRDGHEAFDRLARLRQPVIAALNGHALGGGLELAACADIRIAEEHIKIGQPEAGIGIIAGWSGTQRATRRFGAQSVRRMALFGEIFDAQQAEKLGIVDHIVPTGASLKHAFRVAEKILGRGPLATELTKMLINAAEGEEKERVLEALAGRIAAASSELKEGVSAFSEKRAPQFNKGLNK